jgi:NADPH2:quinone reductase
MMKAVLLTAAGGLENLQLSQVPKPELPGPEYLRVRLRAAGINPVDCKLRLRGGYDPDRLPVILGCDGAGVVEGVGARVNRFKPGDPVFFFNGGIGGAEPGNYAEYTVIHQDYAARKPANLSMEQAAAVPLAWITAWESLIDRGRLQAGQSVLIHAGAGGVGHLALQLAKTFGARVAVTVGGADKIALAQRLGADLSIDYRQRDFVQATLDWTQGRGADVVLDTVGGETFCRSFGAAKIYGQVVTLLEYPCDAAAIKLAKLRNLSLSYELMLTPLHLGMHGARVAQRRMLDAAADKLARGEITVEVSRVLPLEQAAEAQRLVESGHTVGKIVLSMP